MKIVRAKSYLVMVTVMMQMSILTAMACVKELLVVTMLILMKLMRPGFVTTPARVGQLLAMEDVIIADGKLVVMESVKILII